MAVSVERHKGTETPAVIADLQFAERLRCAAIMEGDVDVLATMLADDLIHVHLPGRIDNKSGYLEGVRNKYLFRDLTRGLLDIRIYGNVAVMIGVLTQKLILGTTWEVRDIRAITSQVWLKAETRWLLTTCHNAPLTV
ncbi:MAG: nuclear transport factor 2 family protein [Afipia sp.]